MQRRSGPIKPVARNAEEILRFAGRAREVMAECNRVLVRASDEPQLLQDMCRVAIGKGGYRMAWVGLMRHDEASTIEPVASAGDDNNYLASIRLSWADDEFGQGPAQRAVRTGEPQTVRDIISADPRFFRWRDVALAHGYRAVATLPLISEGKTLGVFGIHADEPQAFEAEEVALLGQLASDIAYGIDNLRRREAQRRAEEKLRQSEARFRSLTRLSSDIYWEQDEQYRFTSFSDTGPDWITSGTRRSIGKRRWEMSYLNISAEDWVAHIALLDARKPFRDLELYRLNEAGERLWVSVSGEPVFDASGAFQGYRGVGKDISARKREEQLRTLEHAVTRSLAEAESASAALKEVIRAICETQSWECGRYWRVDEQAGVLRFGESWSVPDPRIEQFIAEKRKAVVGLGVGLAGRVWQAGEPVWVADMQDDAHALRAAVTLETGMRGAFHFPVKSDGKTIGILAFNSRKVREPEKQLLQAVRVVGSQLGQFLKRKQAEEELRRFRDAMDDSADMIGLIDRSTMRFVDVNSTICRLLGYSREEMLEMGPQDVLPSSRAELERYYDELIADPSVSGGMKSHYRCKDGTLLPFESTRRVLISGDERIITSISRDIRERIAAETALRESNERFDMAVRATHDVIWDRNLLTDEVWWNENYAEVYGRGRDAELRTRSWREGIHPEDRERVLAGIDSVIESGGADWSDEYRIQCGDGSYAEVFDRGHIIREGSGRAVRMIGAMADVTARSAAEAKARNQALEQLVAERTAELEATTKELEAFSYSVSHDLRAPLRHIDGFARLVLERAHSVDETTERYLETISRAAGKMGRLIDDLLAFSRTGRAELRTQSVDLNELVREVREECAREATGRKLTWKIDKLPRVLGDPGLLRIALVNLLSNAVKFTAKREDALIEVGARPGERDEVVVCVKDNGAGYDPRYGHKLFGVFQRLHHESEFDGTGIGLATVRRIATRHGGRVWAEGKIGSGASFYMTLKGVKERTDDR